MGWNSWWRKIVKQARGEHIIGEYEIVLGIGLIRWKRIYDRIVVLQVIQSDGDRVHESSGDTKWRDRLRLTVKHVLEGRNDPCPITVPSDLLRVVGRQLE